MAEPQKMVHLTPAQRKRKKFNHTLTDKIAPQLSKELLDNLLLVYFNTDIGTSENTEVRHRLISNYLRLLRSTVARYLYHWPVSRRFLDEMVSTGAEAIIKVIDNLEPEQLDSEDAYRSLGGLVENAIRHNIETIINKLRGIAPASERTNRRRERRNKRPIYGNIETGLASEDVKNSREYVDIDPFIFELEDTIIALAKTEIERQVLAKENWGLSNAELSKKLGKSQRWVLAVRNRLRERYIKLGETYV